MSVKGELFAVKRVARRTIDKVGVAAVTTEASLLAAIDHPHVMRLHSSFFDAPSGDFLMILELGESTFAEHFQRDVRCRKQRHGELLRYAIEFASGMVREGGTRLSCDEVADAACITASPLIVFQKPPPSCRESNPSRVTDYLPLSFFFQCAQECLHQTHLIVHSDLKPENVLRTSLGSALICDLGAGKCFVGHRSNLIPAAGTGTYMVRSLPTPSRAGARSEEERASM